jgi:transcriptional regulator with XRE-family HTH domain
MVSASDLMMHLARAVGKCQIHMPESCDIGMYQRHNPEGWDLWSALQGRPQTLLRKDATRVPEVRSPTVRRRELGAVLRTLRTEQGLTVEQVAERLLCSSSKVSRMETGHRGATLRDVRDLCDLYGVTDPGERDRLMTLAREGKQQAWWQSYDLPYSTYVGLEAEARTIKDYDSAVVPGLLQTADYTRARHEGTMPRLDPAEIEQRVEVTKTRQLLLTRDDPPRFWFVLDEAALHRVVGGSAVMKQQLEGLIEASKLPNVTVQVISYEIGVHPALDSVFTIVEFAGDVPGVVYVEGLVGSIYLERPEDLDRYQQVFARLCTIALSPEDSVALMQKMRAAHKLESR